MGQLSVSVSTMDVTGDEGDAENPTVVRRSDT